MKSIGAVLDDSRGLGKGFDFLRLALALGVASYHIIQISTGTKEFHGPADVLVYGILIMFFGLSGFLIAGSAQRLTLKNFLINRGLRIFPALCVEVLLSAFILGPIFTQLPLAQYFTHRRFFLYLSNLFGTAYLFLPGVFDGEYVNGSIWTVPYEIACYVIISVLIFFGVLHRAWIVVTFSVALMAAQLAYYFIGAHITYPISHGLTDYLASAGLRFLRSILYDGGGRLLVAFTVGIAAYLSRYRLPYSPALFLTALVVIFCGSAISPFPAEEASNFFVVPAWLYVTIFLGVTNIPLPKFLHKGDYSYGIYLYGFPLTQAIHFSFQEQSRSVLFLFVTSTIFMAAFAVFSWHVIEKPILGLRKKFSFVARQRLEEREPEQSSEPSQIAT